jgi:ubiquinone/menaquinone biosynthesis C-methylase UbiE
MEQYIGSKLINFDPDFISVIDELPLWSAPFGLSLLDRMKIGKSLSVLDIGCCTGFPLIEIAQRLGESSRIYGIDPWKETNARVQLKISTYELKNAAIINGHAEILPFSNASFDIIVSNNGLNNVEDLNKSLAECSRVCKKGAQLLFTMNLDGSMMEFYDAFREELKNDNNTSAIEKMIKHIYEKRRPLNEIRELLNKNSFRINEIFENKFFLRFADCTSMFKHSFIKYWFFDGWKKIIEPGNYEPVFNRIEERLNKQAGETGELKLTIPFAVIDCTGI